MAEPEPPGPEDSTPVRSPTDDEAARLELLRQLERARADRELALVELDALRREIARVRAENRRLDARNDELLASEVERDELRSDCDRLTVQVLQLRRALGDRR